MHYAIDFGTSNTVVARINEDGIIETLKIKNLSHIQLNNPPLIPSLVYVEDANANQVIVGQAVRNCGLDIKNNQRNNLVNNQRFFQNFKRAIAQSGFIPELDGKEITAQQVGAWFLTAIIKELTNPTSLVLTLPVDSFESYRQWLIEICEQLAIAEIRILDEPTAAALGYGLTAGNETVLVIDFGGGTLDMSLVKLNFNPDKPAQNRRQSLDFLLKWGDRLVNRSKSANLTSTNNSTAKVIAKTGQDLGGIDLDQWILEYFYQNQNLPKNSLTLRLAEKLKIALSTASQSTEVFFDDRTFNSYCLELDRPQFQNILKQHNFFTRLEQSLNQINQQAHRQNLELQSIDAVLLVGGTAQIPAVYDWVNQHFPKDKIKFSQAFEAIAHGALSPNFQVQDFLYHSYGVRYWDKRHRQHNWHPIITAGATYPTPPTELILGASQPNQPSIEIVVGELGESNLEVYFDQDSLITRQLKSTQTMAQTLKKVVAPLNPLGQLGSDRLKVTFNVDAQRSLCITITDLLINQIILPYQPIIKLM